MDSYRGVLLLGGVVCFLLASVVGASELIARYRDRPGGTLRTAGAFVYLVVNGAAAVGAYWLIGVYNVDFGVEGPALEPTRIMVASFGSVAFFRSSLFLTRINDTDVGIGPSALLATLLSAADRSVDKRRAMDRSKEATVLVQSFSFEKARVALPALCLFLLQNVTPEEQHRLGIDVEAIRSADMSDRQRSLALGLKLISLAGHEVVVAAISALGDEIRPTEPR